MSSHTPGLVPGRSPARRVRPWRYPRVAPAISPAAANERLPTLVWTTPSTNAAVLETYWDATNPTPELAGLRVCLTQLFALPPSLVTQHQRTEWNVNTNSTAPLYTTIECVYRDGKVCSLKVNLSRVRRCRTSLPGRRRPSPDKQVNILVKLKPLKLPYLIKTSLTVGLCLDRFSATAMCARRGCQCAPLHRRRDFLGTS